MISFAQSFSVSSVLIAAATLLVVPNASASNLVVNGGFENTVPYPGQNSLIRIPDSWTLSDPDTGNTAVECGGGTAHTGSCGAYFENYTQLGSLSQALSTTPGTEYLLSFYMESSGQPQSPGQPNEFIVGWGGTDVLDLTNIPAQPYTLYTFDVTATSTSTELSFSGLNNIGVTYVDDVSVEAVNATPEPGTFALLGTGLLSCVGFARRRLRV